MNAAVIFRAILATILPLTILLVRIETVRGEQRRSESFRLRLVPIKTGNERSSFGNDPERFRQTAVFKAAAAAGVDLRNPADPHLVFACQSDRLFYLFYNQLGVNTPGQYVIQRIKRTQINHSADGQVVTAEDYLVEAIKLLDGRIKRPDQHFGSYGLRNQIKREVIKEFEVGVGRIEAVAEGAMWPFNPRLLYKQIQPYGARPGVYDKVVYSDSIRWTLRVSFDCFGNYEMRCDELGIDIGKTSSTKVQATNSGDQAAPADEANDDAKLPKVQHIIDTHIHLYDTERPAGVPWPPRSEAVLFRPHLPEDFKQVAKPVGVTGVVIVEASTWLQDNQWVLDLVKDDKFFLALVGNIDLNRADFEQQLDRYCKDPRYVGIRARNDAPIDFTNPTVLANCRLLAQRDRSLDILVSGIDINAIDRLARAVPDLRIIVDHVLGHQINGQPVDPQWTDAVRRLAENKNVFCKVSGLYQQSARQPAPKEIEYYRRVLDVLWDQFGSQRLIYGSNWPVTKRSGDYRSFITLVHEYFTAKGQDACESYYWKNAVRAYRLQKLLERDGS